MAKDEDDDPRMSLSSLNKYDGNVSVVVISVAGLRSVTHMSIFRDKPPPHTQCLTDIRANDVDEFNVGFHLRARENHFRAATARSSISDPRVARDLRNKTVHTMRNWFKIQDIIQMKN